MNEKMNEKTNKKTKPRKRGPILPAQRKAMPLPIVIQMVSRLAPLGAVVARPMFGGHGIFLDGLMFGLVWSGTVYLKVDDETRGDYESAGMKPFKPYEGRDTAFSYFEVPPAVLDMAETLRAYATKAHGAARRAQAKKKPAQRRPHLN
ncbi:MAG: TfoX family protein [Alphaproteobacteria bacterium]|nr:TfoX family protein [Alphaproteobacteria bacterium]